MTLLLLSVCLAWCASFLGAWGRFGHGYTTKALDMATTIREVSVWSIFRILAFSFYWLCWADLWYGILDKAHTAVVIFLMFFF